MIVGRDIMHYTQPAAAVLPKCLRGRRFGHCHWPMFLSERHTQNMHNAMAKIKRMKNGCAVQVKPTKKRQKYENW